ELTKFLCELRIAANLHVAALEDVFRRVANEAHQAERSADQLRFRNRGGVPRDAQRFAGGFDEQAREARNLYADAMALELLADLARAGRSRQSTVEHVLQGGGDHRAVSNDSRDEPRRCRQRGCDSGSLRVPPRSSSLAAFAGWDACESTPRD